MADSFIKTYRFMKGVYEAKFFSLDRTLMYYDNKLTDANIASSVNIGELAAGIGNPTVITMPDTAKFNVTLTAADVELRSRQLQTGGTLGYNGVTDTCEVITATTTALTVTGTPVAPYGYATGPVCYVNGDGTPYVINATTKTVQGFTATVGTQYSVRYYVANASSEVLDIKTLFSPVIGTLEVKMPVFAAPVGQSATAGTLAGYWHVVAPRYQFNGEATVNTNQTTPATSSLSGQALAFDNPSATSCASATPSLIYMVYEPVSTTEGIVDMVVMDGGALTVAANATATIPVKYVMADGMLSQPDLTALTYVSAASSTASVANGVVTGVAAGSTEITITSTTPALAAVCNVTVTA